VTYIFYRYPQIIVRFKMGKITLELENGSFGGKMRKFSVKSTAEVEVDEDDSYDEMMKKIVKAFSGQFASGPHNIQLDKAKTVSQNGLKNGDTLQFYNGMLD